MVKVRPRHVLVVDDNDAVRTTLSDVLEGHGVRVTSAGDGISMRECLRRDNIDAVLLDIRMPGEDGYSLALYAKELRLPVIIMSGNDDELEFADRLNLPLLRKPFRIEELLDALDTVLATHVVPRESLRSKKNLHTEILRKRRFLKGF